MAKPTFIMKAKKSFGQHFLNSEDVASRIASSFSQKDALTALLEVGPGKGVLTKYLVKMPVEFLAVEADADMVGYLAHYLPETEGKIIQADFLKLPLDDLFDRKPFGLIGNFPYNISSQILIKMLQHRDQIPEMVGMFQKELAERVIAGPGSKTYGVISVLVQAYYRCEYLFTVQPGSFSPPPKVKSGVIRLNRIENRELGCPEKLFRAVVKTAFNQRRKMLRNTMKAMVSDEECLKDAFFNKRPEQLSVEDFVYLTNFVQENQ